MRERCAASSASSATRSLGGGRRTGRASDGALTAGGAVGAGVAALAAARRGARCRPEAAASALDTIKGGREEGVDKGCVLGPGGVGRLTSRTVKMGCVYVVGAAGRVYTYGGTGAGGCAGRAASWPTRSLDMQAARAYQQARRQGGNNTQQGTRARCRTPRRTRRLLSGWTDGGPAR